MALLLGTFLGGIPILNLGQGIASSEELPDCPPLGLVLAHRGSPFEP
jgi:hypothetical protein